MRLDLRKLDNASELYLEDFWEVFPEHAFSDRENRSMMGALVDISGHGVIISSRHAPQMIAPK